MKSNKPLAAIVIAEPFLSEVITPSNLQRLNSEVDSVQRIGTPSLETETLKDLLENADVCITSWGSPSFDSKLLDMAPNLKMIAHAAGSVRCIVTDELWDRGIRITSAAAANAIDVAHTTVALMTLSMKNAFRLRDEVRQGAWGDCKSGRSRELYGSVVGIIGASHIGRKVIELLESYEPKILLYDPFVTKETAKEMGVELVSNLDDLIRASDVVSVHAPSLPATRHMLNEKNLPLMKDGAILINTARGALIDEAALVEQLKTGRIFACLDVTNPEPCAQDSPFRVLPNVFLTPHMAGSVTEGRGRIGALAVDEVISFLSGKPLRYEVTREMMERIA